MNGERQFCYLARGAYNGKIGASHLLYKDSIIVLNGDKYRVQEDAMPSEEPRIEGVIYLTVIEVHAVAIY